MPPPKNAKPFSADKHSITVGGVLMLALLIGFFYIMGLLINKFDSSILLALITSDYAKGAYAGLSAGVTIMLILGKIKSWIKNLF
jgi:hypothetical protein